MNQLYKVIFKVAEFEKRREAERKRNEEEKRRARRDRMLLEKAARDKKGVEEKKAAEEIEELHNKVGKLWSRTSGTFYIIDIEHSRRGGLAGDRLA